MTKKQPKRVIRRANYAIADPDDALFGERPVELDADGAAEGEELDWPYSDLIGEESNGVREARNSYFFAMRFFVPVAFEHLQKIAGFPPEEWDTKLDRWAQQWDFSEPWALERAKQCLYATRTYPGDDVAYVIRSQTEVKQRTFHYEISLMSPTRDREKKRVMKEFQKQLDSALDEYFKSDPRVNVEQNARWTAMHRVADLKPGQIAKKEGEPVDKVAKAIERFTTLIGLDEH